jgi:hypothetical protein
MVGPGEPDVLVICSQGRLWQARSGKPLKPGRDLGVVPIRVIAAAGADELMHVAL